MSNNNIEAQVQSVIKNAEEKLKKAQLNKAEKEEMRDMVSSINAKIFSLTQARAELTAFIETCLDAPRM